MLTLNRALQKAGKKLYVQFCRVKYISSKVISAFLNKKIDSGLLIQQKSNFLI